MKIRMLSTQNGSLDGIRVAIYEAGKEYDLSESVGARALAKAFVDARMAIQAPPDPAQSAPVEPVSAGFFTPVVDAEPEEKAIEAAPENKMVKRAHNRKGK